VTDPLHLLFCNFELHVYKEIITCPWVSLYQNIIFCHEDLKLKIVYFFNLNPCN